MFFIVKVYLLFPNLSVLMAAKASQAKILRLPLRFYLLLLVDSSLYHVAVVLSFLRIQISLAVISVSLRGRDIVLDECFVLYDQLFYSECSTIPC